MYDFARGELYEKGKVCSSELTGYFFMQTDCKDTKNVGFLVGATQMTELKYILSCIQSHVHSHVHTHL